MPEQPKAQLPSPASVFLPDPNAEYMARVMTVEDALYAEHGMHFAPNAQGQLQYFASHIDARYWRRLAAQRIVRTEERSAELYAALQSQPHGAVFADVTAGR